MAPDRYRFRDAQDEKSELHADGLLTPRERDEVFRRLKLDAKLTALDDLDKDILVVDSRALTLAELRRYYPMLNVVDLNALKAAVEAAR